MELETVILKELKMHDKETKWHQIFVHLLKQKNKQDNPEHTEVNMVLLEK